MNDGRPASGNLGFAQPTPVNPTLAPPLRQPPAAPGIGLRPQPGNHLPNHHAPNHHVPAHPAPTQHSPRPVIDEPLELEGDDEPKPVSSTEPPKSKIHQISSGGSLPTHSYSRATHSNKTGAVRMRTFHCRLSEQGVDYLDQTVNDWLEHHPDIEVKFTTSTIGLWDGKLKEPTLILNVWY